MRLVFKREKSPPTLEKKEKSLTELLILVWNLLTSSWLTLPNISEIWSYCEFKKYTLLQSGIFKKLYKKLLIDYLVFSIHMHWAIGIIKCFCLLQRPSVKCEYMLMYLSLPQIQSYSMDKQKSTKA
jgi:hypothetical protein